MVHYFRAQKKDDDISINVFIDEKKNNQKGLLFEYESILNIVSNVQKENDYPVVFVKLYFCDDSEIVQARNAVSKYNWNDSENSEIDIYDVIKDAPVITIAFDETGKGFTFTNGECIEWGYHTYFTQREGFYHGK